MFSLARQDASVGVWTPSLHFQHGFDASEEEPNVAPLLTGSVKKSRVMVTDCVVMENCSKLVLAVTKRELQFHDIPSNVGTGRTIRVKVFGEPAYRQVCVCTVLVYIHVLTERIHTHTYVYKYLHSHL